jgi:fibronectin-binding autotransporter adhesin
MKAKINLNTKQGRQNGSRRRFVSASLLIAAGLFGQNLWAADAIWTGGAGGLGTDWGTSGNWSPANVPGASDNAVFNGTSLSNVCYIDMGAAGGTQQVGSITLTANQGSSMTLGNSSSTTPGTLVLNGVGGILVSNGYVGGGELIIENGLAGATGGTNLNIGLAASGVIYSSSTLVASTAAGRISIYSVISDFGGSHGITLTGPGNVYLRGVNTYSGDTTILNGALELDAVGTAGNGAGTIYLSGGNIQSGASRNGYSSGNFIANPIMLTADAHIFNSGSTANSTRNIAFSGSLGGSAGTLIICNPTSVSGNYFIPRFSGSFTFNQPVVVGDTSNDAFADNTSSFSGLDMCNASTNGAQTWNGTISGPGSLYRTSPIKANSLPGGACILTGNNTFSGGTTIQSGSLFANNTAGSALGSGAVTVNNQGTLAGNGAVIAPATVSAGGTIQPGSTSSSIGNLAVSSLTNGPGANYNWQISSVTGTPGTAWDLITCSSGWTDAGTSVSPNVIHLVSVGPPTGWNNATAYTWLIISNNPANSPGFNAANWIVDTTDFGGTAAGRFSLSTDANGSLDLVYTPLPGSNPVAHMLMLAPGETTTFGTAPGKTGSPTAQNSTIPYSVTVDALDVNYKLCTNSIDTVGVMSSSNGDILPANAPLVNGTMTFSVANNAVGNITLTATNVTEGSAVPTGSSTVPVNINATTTTLVSSANPAGVAIPIDFTAYINSSAQNITGTVTFKNGTLVMGTEPVTVGQTATITLSGGAGTN